MIMLTVVRITDFDSQLIDEIAEIEAEAFGDGGLNRWTLPVLIRHGAVYVLKCDDAICAVADIVRDWDDPGLVFIVNFVVKKGERGKGLGFKFLSELAGLLRGNGVKRMQLTVDPLNEQAIRLYGKVGFKQVAELHNEYGPAVDRLLFEFELEECDYGRR